MTIQRLRTLYLEIVTILHQLNPCFMSIIFKVKSSDRPACSHQNLNLKVVRDNKVKFGKEFKSLRTKNMK